MASVIKTISLDGRTQKIAETIPNFSQWVRAKLLELEESRLTPRVKYRYTCNECDKYYIFHKKRDWWYCRTDGCNNRNDLVYTEFRIDVE